MLAPVAGGLHVGLPKGLHCTLKASNVSEWAQALTYLEWGQWSKGVSKLRHPRVPLEVVVTVDLPVGTRDPQLAVNVLAEVPPPPLQGPFKRV